ncbi:Hsp70 family protein [Pseudofrankia sp. DC12]|uniref:Hsp70 family protein n=1 Tax=Pseudofrankia sp. DC12 TaxID=683315 RepID=UPI000697AE1F|nr:Hsp70 family protein [Pseudofrankia sp. DC12]
MTFGIDFGTSNSVLARSNGQDVEIVPVDSGQVPAQWRQPEFEDLFPSVLGIRPLQRTLCFGWAAKTVGSEPVDAVKRMLGTRSAGSQQVDDGTPRLEEHNIWLGGEPFRSTAAAASLFAEMKLAAGRSFLELDEAVVTVPANATGGARYRTRAAARLAGIRVKALLNEPTAAAVSYVHDIAIEGRLLIFDWGGGTIDVTVLEYDGKFFEERSSRGIAALGGLEFDEALARIFITKLGQTPENLSKVERARWRREVELTKIALSQPDASELAFDLPARGVSLTVARAEYIDAVTPLITRAMEPLYQCLEDTGIGSDKIDAVLMIGGTSQIPEAREAVGKVLSPESIVPAELCHPMTAVARGAAIYGAALDDPDQHGQFALVTNYDLGTAFDAGPRRGFKPIIGRNRTLVALGEMRFVPNRPHAYALNIEIVEGEAGFPADSDRAFPLSNLQVTLPRREADPEANAVIVKFRYDHSGILKVTVIHEKSGRELLSDELDSFGEDGTPLQTGLREELIRLLGHTDVPFAEAGTDEPLVEAKAPVPGHVLPLLDGDLTVNGRPQRRL